MTNSVALGLVNIGIALLTFGISLPLALGKVGPNPWYGVRLPKAAVSRENWDKLNRYGGRWLVVYSALVGIIGITSCVGPEMKVGGLWFWFVLFTALHQLPIPLIAIFRFAGTLPDK